jgi:hypothetical protein
MPTCLSTIISLPLIGSFGQRLLSVSQQLPSLFHPLTHESIEPTSKRRHSSIHTLNDDVLLNIFYLFRLDIQDEEWHQMNFVPHWDRQRWWYKLAQVCRQWRSLIYLSPSRLDLHLLCTYGTPVADMLTHSPPLPLTIYYYHNHQETTAEDEEGIRIALRHRDRVHHVRLALPTSSLQNIISVMDEPFPVLERMYIKSQTDDDARLALPKTFQAPLLHHFALETVGLQIGCPLFMNTMGLVILALERIPSSLYFPPSHLLTWLSRMPQLEKLVIRFQSPLPSRDVTRQLSSASTMTHTTLPHLRFLFFRGVSAYLEGVLARISTPPLIKFEIEFFNQLTFAVPRLLMFMLTTENFNLRAMELNFSGDRFFLRGDVPSFSPFYIRIMSKHLDWQVSSAAQILIALEPVLPIVEGLMICHTEFGRRSSEWHNEVARTQWRELLRPFVNVKILRVQSEFVEELGRSLHSEGEEMTRDILSNLKELRFSGGSKNGDVFRPFIKQRRAVGYPVDVKMAGLSEFPRYTVLNEDI